jgi:multiple sugar transport system substrate-binding protein
VLKYITLTHADLFAGPKAMHPGYQLKTDEEKTNFNSLIFKNKPGLDYDMAMSVMARDRDLVSKDNTVKAGQVAINDAIRNYMTLVFSGEMTPADALAQIKAEGDAAIKADSGN